MRDFTSRKTTNEYANRTALMILVAMQAEREARSYDRLWDEDKLTSNADFEATEDASAACEYEDDFM